MDKARLKELATYWYFHFPKWMWTALICVLFVLFNAWIASVFPNIFKFRIHEWWTRIFSFWLAAGLLLLCGSIAFVVVAWVVIGIYDALPSDPRKRKGDAS